MSGFGDCSGTDSYFLGELSASLSAVVTSFFGYSFVSSGLAIFL